MKRAGNDGLENKFKDKDDCNSRFSTLFAETMDTQTRTENLKDVNPIMDERASFSIGGINNATHLCDALGIPLVPHNHYLLTITDGQITALTPKPSSQTGI